MSSFLSSLSVLVEFCWLYWNFQSQFMFHWFYTYFCVCVFNLMYFCYYYFLLLAFSLAHTHTMPYFFQFLCNLLFFQDSFHFLPLLSWNLFSLVRSTPGCFRKPTACDFANTILCYMHTTLIYHSTVPGILIYFCN